MGDNNVLVRFIKPAAELEPNWNHNGTKSAEGALLSA
jgi:hypothetical protein